MTLSSVTQTLRDSVIVYTISRVAIVGKTEPEVIFCYRGHCVKLGKMYNCIHGIGLELQPVQRPVVT